MKYDKIILGIDPGTNVMGYGVIGIQGKTPVPMALGVIKLTGLGDHYRRLARIYERVSSLMDQYHPTEVAIEAPFFGKNVQSMLKLGRAQGVAMAAVLSRDIPITEYAPLKIKQSVTGNGRASKEQVANMVQRILNIAPSEMPSLLDATDAIAAAVTHFYESGKPQLPKSSKNWADFLRQNPDRIATRKTKPKNQ